LGLLPELRNDVIERRGTKYVVLWSPETAEHSADIASWERFQRETRPRTGSASMAATPI